MIQYDDTTLRALQMIQLELLCEVRRVCEVANIHYNIIAGTLLGAIRHGGYIPWDDDSDVAFLREEYEKFRDACEEHLNHDLYYFQDYRNTPGYRWGYGKLRKKGTIFQREHQEHMPYDQGICIDLFPMDKIPENLTLRKIHIFHCYCIRKLLWSAVGQYTDSRRYVRVWYKIISKIPMKLIIGHMGRFIRRTNRRKSDKVRILTIPMPRWKVGYSRSWYTQSKLYEFEGEIFQGIGEAHTYLTFAYGNYMKLPPESKRKTHPASRLVLGEQAV